MKQLKIYVKTEEDSISDCLESVVNHGHKIIGIFTENEKIQEWAKEHNIDVHPTDDLKQVCNAEKANILINFYRETPTLPELDKKLEIYSLCNKNKISVIKFHEFILNLSRGIKPKIPTPPPKAKKRSIHPMKLAAKFTQLQQIFEYWTERIPNQDAVVYENEKITYRELNTKAEYIAKLIRLQYKTTYKTELPPNTLIGLHIDRGIHMILGIISILKAGAAYLPLDTQYPAERLEYMVENSGAQLLLTTGQFKANFPTQPKIILDTIDYQKNLPEITRPTLSQNNLAYVIYTSGSTGKPKGVEITHANIINLMQYINFNFSYQQHGRGTSWGTMNFDVALYEIWCNFLVGGTLYIIAEMVRMDPLQFFNFLSTYKIDFTFMPPFVLKSFVSWLEIHTEPIQLSTLFTGVEPIATSTFAAIQEALPDIHLYNAYGPTETTVFVTCFQYQKEYTGSTIVPIGTPIEHTKVYLLDENKKLVNPGEEGEIFIGGKGVAKGYINNPSLTKNKFVMSPFDPNEKLYQTGDWATQQKDGNLIFKERRDSQIKIHGHRIELKEIEIALNKQAGVQQSVVAIKTIKDEPVLVAYLICTDKIVDFEPIRKALIQILPNYMMPLIYLPIDHIPVTPNGKIDRSALPTPEIAELKMQYIAPSNKFEVELAEIWSKILGVKEISANDLFFNIGGHSLLIPSTIMEIHQKFGVALTIKEFIANDNLYSQAKLIAQKQKSTEITEISQVKFPKVEINPQQQYADFPLSIMQQAFWINRQNPNIPNQSYLYLEFRCNNLDIAQLEIALNKLITRHAMLRAVIEENGYQHVLAEPPHYTINLHDWSKLSADLYDHHLTELRKDIQAQIFDPRYWPLFSIHISRYKKEDYIHFKADALIFDSLSEIIFFTDLSMLYQNNGDRLKKLVLTFRDYQLTYNKINQLPEYQADKKYWIDRLPQFPLGPILPHTQNSKAAKQIVYKNGTINIENLLKKSNQYQISLNTVLLTAFIEVLRKWSKVTHFAINLMLYNRLPLNPEVTDIIGPFTSSLIFEVAHKRAEQTFINTALVTQEQLAADLEHRLYSGIEFQAELNRLHQRDSQTAIAIVFNSTVNISHELQRDLLAGNFESTGHAKSVKSDVLIDCNVHKFKNKLQITWGYQQNYFPNQLIGEMFSAYLQLLTDLSLKAWNESFSILSARDKKIITRANSVKQLPPVFCLHQRFLQQANLTPNNIAIYAKTHQISYQTLQHKVNQLAHALIKHEVKSNQLVAILLKKGWRQALASLAILTAGAGYLPLTPIWPINRIEEVLEQSDASIVITETDSITQLPLKFKNNDNYTIINLDNSAELEKFTTETPNVKSKLDDIAYVIFTSGSTGKPKGVTITHYNVVNTLNDINRHFSINEKDRTFALSRITFDLSVYDIFGPLISGGAVVFPDPDKLMEPAHWLELIEKYRITIWNSVPAFMQMFIEHLSYYKKEPIYSLKLVLLSGDWIEPKLPRKIYKYFPYCDVISLGGATEGSVWSIIFMIPRAGKHERIPYGYSMANQHMYVLNQSLEHCPVGVVGDIYIGGIGVAKGYWKNPEKSKENFIYHPLSGEYLYRTGDLGSWSHHGYIEYMGRADTQIKIAGHRIELGEITSTLMRNPQVKSSAVIHLPAETTYEIIAFYTGHENASDTLTRELKEYLASMLPGYMLPRKLIKVEKIPLTENGKIDKAALVAIYKAEKTALPSITASRKTENEKMLAQIWADILGLDASKIEPEDNFFELGGHSLLIIQTLLAIHQKLGGTVTVRNFIESKSLRELLQCIQQTDQTYPTIVPDPAHENEPFPLTDIQQAYWLGRNGGLELSEISTHIYQEFTLNHVDISRLEHALNKVIQHHGMLRAILPSATEQRILAEVPYYTIKTQDLKDQADDEQQIEMLKTRQHMSHQNLDSNQWPLFDIRASLIDKNKIRLHVSIDALILDAWSLDIFFSEWAELTMHSEQVLPPIHLSFRDYILGLEKVRQTDQYNRDKQYWLNRLNSLPPGPEIPKLKYAHNIKNQRSQTQRTAINSNIWNALKSLAKKHEILPSAVVMAIFAEVLSHWSATQHYVLNLTLFNRLPLHPAVNEILGDFTSLNMLEINHTNIQTTSFLDRAKALQNQLLHDLDHRLFSGVAVQRELSKLNKTFALGTRVPIVFTSIIDEDHKFYTDEQSPFAYGNMNFRSTQSSQVWLDHKVYSAKGALVTEWDYVAELFPDKLIENMHQAFCDIFTRLAVQPEIWTQNIALFSEQTLPKIPERTFENSDALLHELFIKNVEKNPQQPAILTPTEEISYQTLYQSANQIAFVLNELDIGTNQLVAIYMQKGWQQVVACLAVLISGAAYVPIDPELPIERTRHLLQETKARCILTTRSEINDPNYKELQNGDITVITVDDKNLLKQTPAPAFFPKQSTKDLAYVTYTSGTTGKPKGIMINHAAVVNTILDINHRFNLTPQDRVLALSNLNFDLSVYDIFGTLAFGGTIVMPDAKREKDPQHWFELLLQKQVTVWNSVPAFMKIFTNYIQLLHLEAEIQYHHLRLVLLSGDWIPLDLPSTINHIFGDIQIMSLGGATEASIWSVIYPVDVHRHYERSIPYGKALENQGIFVLDQYLQPCPTWVTGEIYIAGKGLAEGYWADLEKTNKQFIQHPETKMRLYKTGDCGRLLPDSNIEFLGRQDFQVKVNGFRIELNDIDENLKSFPDIDNALSIVQETVGQKIITFYSTRDKQSHEEHKIKAHLRQYLPNYMIPAKLVWIEEFPLTENGKINRKLFTATAATYIPPTTTQIKHAPNTNLQKSLADIFKEELNLSDIDMQDNFFDLGADSLTLVNIYSKISQRLQVNLSMTELFNYPNLLSLAEFLTSGKTAKKSSAEVAKRYQLRKTALQKRNIKRGRTFSRGAKK